MSKLLGTDASVSQVLNRVSDLVFLNLLTLLCCLPIITVGASITALYATVTRMQQGYAKVYGGFFKTFGIRFLKATVLWLPVLAVAAGTVYYMYIGVMIPAAVGAVLLILGCAVLAWAFPLLARFGEGIGQTLKTAVRLAVTNLSRTVTMTVLNLLPVVLFVFANGLFSKGIMIWLFLYVSLIAWFNQGMLNRIFAKLAPQEEK